MKIRQIYLMYFLIPLYTLCFAIVPGFAEISLEFSRIFNNRLKGVELSESRMNELRVLFEKGK